LLESKGRGKRRIEGNEHPSISCGCAERGEKKKIEDLSFSILFPLSGKGGGGKEKKGAPASLFPYKEEGGGRGDVSRSTPYLLFYVSRREGGGEKGRYPLSAEKGKRKKKGDSPSLLHLGGWERGRKESGVFVLATLPLGRGKGGGKKGEKKKAEALRSHLLYSIKKKSARLFLPFSCIE